MKLRIGTKYCFNIPHNMDEAQRKSIYQKLCILSSPSPSFYLMVALSTIIAAYGLLANSTAVVIGAMLVAPLMGPIFGIALGISNGDKRLLKAALVSEFFGILIAVGLAAIIGMVPLRLGFGTEIMARTQPNIYDIIIALVSGLAGAFAMVEEKIGAALPGVAIATALVPPLATCGLCLSVQNWEWAWGAFLLFFVNLLAIEFAAATVYALSGLIDFKRIGFHGYREFMNRFWISLIILISMGIFMSTSLVKMARDHALSENLEKITSQQVAVTAGARLSDLQWERSPEGLKVMAVVLTPKEIEPSRVAEIEKELQDSVSNNLHLVVRSLISKDADHSGQVFISEYEKAQRSKAQEQNQFLGQVSRSLSIILQEYPGSILIDIQNTIDQNYLYSIIATVRTPTPITPVQVAEIEQIINQSLNKPIRLTIRSVLTRDADAYRFIYDDKPAEKILNPEEVAFRQNLENQLKEEIHRLEPAANLIEFNFGKKDEDLLVIALVRSPYSLGPKEVSRIETALNRQTDEKIQLIIRSTVGADATSEWYLGEYDDKLLEAASQEKIPDEQPIQD